MSIYLYMAFIDDMRALGINPKEYTLKELEMSLRAYKCKYNR